MVDVILMALQNNTETQTLLKHELPSKKGLAEDPEHRQWVSYRAEDSLRSQHGHYNKYCSRE